MKKLSLKKVLLIVVLFCIAITTIRLIWYNIFDTSESINSSEAILDLSKFDFSSNVTILLDDQWRFYPNELIDPSVPFAQQKVVRFAPSDEPWNLGNDSMYGYGSYALQIRVPENSHELMALFVSEINSASSIYIDGELVYSSGHVGKGPDTYSPGERPGIVRFAPNPTGLVEIVVQVANYDNPKSGGMVTPLRFGSADAVALRLNVGVGLTILAVTIYFLHAIYGVILYSMVKRANRDIRWLYFSLILLMITLATLLTERILMMIGFLSFEWNHRLMNAGVLLGALFLVELLKAQRPKFRTSKFYMFYQLNIIGFFFVGLLSPLSVILQIQAYMALFSFIPYIHAMNIFYRYVKNVNRDTIYLFLAMCASFISFGWLLVIERMNLDYMTYPLDLLISLLCVIIYFYREYFKVLYDKEALTEELYRTNKAKDKFLMMIAHELHNPIQVIRNITGNLLTRKDSFLDETIEPHIQKIDAVGNKLWSMVEDMLELERIADKQIQLKKSNVSLQAIATSVRDSHSYLLNGNDVRIHLEIPPDLQAVVADEKRLTQILSNLVLNAITYTERGAISIRVKALHPFIQISVHHTGKVITREQMYSVFEPSMWGELQVGQEKEGLGLALYIAKGLVELHGSSMHVSSNEEKGTSFSFMLPVAEGIVPLARANPPSLAAPETVKQPDSSEGERIRLLIVDDHTPNLRLLQSYFDPFRFKVFMVGSGKEALTLIDKFRMDLVLVDSALPDFSGYQLTKEIRENYTMSELPVLLITSYMTEEINRAGFEAGVNDSIGSPIDPIELVSRVHSLVGMKKAIEERLVMEAAWLHAQIKPHFLINTFLSIAALGRIDSDRMDALISELSTYIRLSINFQNEQGEAPLERELTLVRSYLAIQKERFEERVQIEWELEETTCVFLPPLTLQSVVENAVSHGILGRPQGGIVKIQIKKLEEGTCFIVQDTGVGMSEEKLAQLFTHKPGFETTRGVGLLNTNRRLKQRYNRGLEIESTVGVGTIVRFTIPNQ